MGHGRRTALPGDPGQGRRRDRRDLRGQVAAAAPIRAPTCAWTRRSRRGSAPASQQGPRCWPRSTSALRLPGGERVQIAVRSTSHRRSSVIAASVSPGRDHGAGPAMGGRSRGRARQPGTPVTRRNGEPSVELVGYAQPCVAYPGGTVDVKVSSTLPEFTAEVVRLGLQAEPASPPVGGRFPGRYQESSQRLLPGGRPERGGAGHGRADGDVVVLPQLAVRTPVPDGGAGPRRGLGAGDRRGLPGQRGGAARTGRAAAWPLRRPGARDRALVLRGRQLGRRGPGHPGGPAPQLRERRPAGRFRTPGRRRAARPGRALPGGGAHQRRRGGTRAGRRTGASTGRSTLRDCSPARWTRPAWPPSRLTHRPRGSAACATSGASARTRRGRRSGSATPARAGATERSSTRPRWA